MRPHSGHLKALRSISLIKCDTGGPIRRLKTFYFKNLLKLVVQVKGLFSPDDDRKVFRNFQPLTLLPVEIKR